MPYTVPHLSLSLGQMAWALNYGEAAPKRLLDQLRYLRMVGIPIAQEEGQGSGNRLTYDFDALIETGVALFAMEHGMKVKEIAEYLVEKRTWLRREARKIYRALPDGAMKSSWLDSRGQTVPMLTNDVFLRVSDRHSQKAGVFELLGHEAVGKTGHFKLGFSDIVERLPGGGKRYCLPLTRLIMTAVHWALKAPPMAPGPRRRDAAAGE